jgi:hypothetical protein
VALERVFGEIERALDRELARAASPQHRYQLRGQWRDGNRLEPTLYDMGEELAEFGPGSRFQYARDRSADILRQLP